MNVTEEGLEWGETVGPWEPYMLISQYWSRVSTESRDWVWTLIGKGGERERERGEKKEEEAHAINLEMVDSLYIKVP